MQFLFLEASILPLTCILIAHSPQTVQFLPLARKIEFYGQFGSYYLKGILLTYALFSTLSAALWYSFGLFLRAGHRGGFSFLGLTWIRNVLEIILINFLEIIAFLEVIILRDSWSCLQVRLFEELGRFA